MNLTDLLNRILPRRHSPNIDSIIDHEPSESNAEEGLEKASRWWGKKASEEQRQNVHSSWAECPVIMQEYIAPQISGPDRQGWLETVARDFFPSPVALALSLGCGSGGLERHVVDLRIARKIDGLDISAEAIEIARQLAKDSGQHKKIRYAVANLNQLEFKPSIYDAAFASQSVHHIEALAHYMAQVYVALKPGGLFVINEFIEPNQFQWTETQLELSQELLESIPEKFRVSIRGEGIKHKIHRPTLDEMNDYDPTEAICSEEIIGELSKVFNLFDRRDFGGTLLHLVLDDIAGNLSFCDEGKEILRRLYQTEQQYRDEGRIGSDFTLLIARKD